MRVVSVNVGLPRRERWQGREVTTGIFKEPVEGRVPLRRLNLDGDGQADLAVHGGAAKAVYAYPLEHYAFWREQLGEELPLGAFGENLTVEGLPLEEEVAVGDRVRVGSAELVVTQPRLPCHKLALRLGREDMVKRFLASRRTGYYLAVEAEGDVGAGDAIEIVARHLARVAVAEITHVYTSDRDDLATLQRLATLDALPDDWRSYLGKRLTEHSRSRPRRGAATAAGTSTAQATKGGNAREVSMSHQHVKPKRFGSVVGVMLVLAAIVTSVAAAASGTPTVPPQTIDDSQLQALTTFIGRDGFPLPTTRTIPHWWASTFDPQDGITYGYNMAGANPNTCTGAACDVTVQVDITPVILHLAGMTFSGSDVLPATLASPVFALNDYGSTPYATIGNWFTGTRGSGGLLSQGDAGNLLQLQDATMRAQFNKTGASSYHLRLNPNVLPAVTVDVPQGKGMLLRSGRGVVFAGIEERWWAAEIQQLEQSADPTHLALYLTDDLGLFFQHANGFGCCAIGFHSALSAGLNETGPGNSNGDAPVQTFAWASYLSPGLFARPNGGNDWAVQDILPLSHEISEWADDPYASNFAEPYSYVPGFPQYGCAVFLETGDPVGNAGFAMGTNTFRQGPNPNGTQSADGYYHPEDEVTLPWFMRLAPNLVSEPTQTPSPDVGRYTFMGSLDQFAGLTEPPPLCGP